VPVQHQQFADISMRLIFHLEIKRN